MHHCFLLKFVHVIKCQITHQSSMSSSIRQFNQLHQLNQLNAMDPQPLRDKYRHLFADFKDYQRFVQRQMEIRIQKLILARQKKQKQIQICEQPTRVIRPPPRVIRPPPRVIRPPPRVIRPPTIQMTDW